MLSKTIYGNDITSSFNEATTSSSQFVKPKIVIEWLDSRHCTNKTFTTNDPHSSNSQGDIGYFFSTDQVANGYRRQSSTWAVCDALDINGHTIKADGNWFAMPNDKKENYEYGWWSNSKSTSNTHSTYSGYEFTVNPTLTMSFDSRKCNLVRVFTSEFSGQIDTYRITVRSSDLGVPSPLYTGIGRIQDGEYYFDHMIPESLGHQTVNQVELEIITTKNPNDYARVECLDVLLEVDVSDYVTSYSLSKTRDLHETSLPIAGSDSGTLDIDLDNTSKDFNVFSNTSEYGQYLTKDLRIRATSGWQTVPYDSQYVTTQLRSNLSNSSSTINVIDNSDFPSGGVGNYFVLEIDPETVNREYVLCSSKSGTYDISVIQRGFNKTLPKNHNVGAVVRFDTFEYPEYSEYFTDEWNLSTSDMIAKISCFDWNKYMSERILNEGFFIEKSTVSDACEGLMLKTNFPKADIQSLNRFDLSAKKLGGILHFDFNEPASDRSGNDIVVSDGLRSRFFSIPSAFPSKIRDITADALDRELTQLEKALGETSFISPDYTALSSSISSNTSLCLDLVNFSFNDKDGNTVSESYNMVFDGFYIPQESGSQYLYLYIAEGGVRIYIDDTLVLNEWRLHDATYPTYYTIQSDELNLTAGNIYKIRIEAFHQYGDFSIKLAYAAGAAAPTFIPKERFKTVSAVDRIASRNASYTPGDLDRNKQQNYLVYLGNPVIGIREGLPSNSENLVVNFGGTKYARLPYHSSWDLNNTSSVNYNNGKWSIEFYAKMPNVYSGDGEYLSNWDSSSSSKGIEFYNNSSSHGVKIVTTSGVETVSSLNPLSTTDYTHIVCTFDGTTLSYYVNGNLEDSKELAGTIVSWSSNDLTFAGRGANFDFVLVPDGKGGTTSSPTEFPPANIRDIYFDEFIIYPISLSASQVSNRYTESQMQELTVYPFLYGGEESVRQVIDSITLADLGRFYIDETNIATYEHMNRFFEPTINRHANVQLTINDDDSIVEATQLVQIQTNKVIIKISGIASNLVGLQSLWRADSPTTLAVVNLEANISNTDESIYVSTTKDPPFPKAGYIIIDDEIIKYSNTSPNQFLSLERGYFNTTASSHTANTSVREVKYWDLKYSKAPAFQVRKPFITGIEFEDPDEIAILRFSPDAYGAELIICPTNSVAKGDIVFAEGTNPLTEKVSYTGISGIPVVVTSQNSQIQEQSAEIEQSIAINGVKELVIENEFISDFDHAQKMADFIISKNSSPIPVLEINTLPTPKICVGDRIKISELDAFDIINGEYWVVSKTFNYSDSINQSMTLRKVA